MLKKSDLPPNVTEALVLEYKDGNVEGLEMFLRSMQKYENSLMSIPWLTGYIREHEKIPIQISYVHNASFGEKALKVFTSDMHAIGKDNLAQQAKTDQPDITLLMAGNTYAASYWLVLPDKSAVLWRYNGPSGLLKWKPSDFPIHECGEYAEPFGGCVGATIDPQGNLKQ
jgi:hypothetical protein